MKNLQSIIIICLLIFSVQFSFAQKILSYDEYLADKERGKVVAADVDGADTSLLVYVRPITIFPKRKFKNKRERRRYSRLVRKVKKVCVEFPYNSGNLEHLYCMYTHLILPLDRLLH